MSFVLALRVASDLLPITTDGKRTAQYLWLAARERAYAQKKCSIFRGWRYSCAAYLKWIYEPHLRLLFF